MLCPGSVGLIQALSLPESDEPDYRAEGTTAHHFLERCLREGLDAWQVVGEKHAVCSNMLECTVEMADAIQVFIDTVRGSLEKVDGAKESGDRVYIEHGIDNPAFHPKFYGTVDCGIVYSEFDAEDERIAVLEVDDFKYGQGVVVEVWENKQIMYYAYGLLARHPEVSLVRLRIIQPRGYHPDGPVRQWIVDADVIREWAENTLRPAMIRTETDHGLKPGDHCRFCPAKLACPVMVSLFEAALTANPERVIDLSDATLDAQYPLIAAVKLYTSALEADVFRRLQTGTMMAHAKLVHKKANRVWKPGAVDVLKLNFKEDQLFEPRAFKSPAEVEKLGGKAKPLVHEYAYTPSSGLTVAATSDKRVAVKVTSLGDTFGAPS